VNWLILITKKSGLRVNFRLGSIRVPVFQHCPRAQVWLLVHIEQLLQTKHMERSRRAACSSPSPKSHSHAHPGTNHYAQGMGHTDWSSLGHELYVLIGLVLAVSSIWKGRVESISPETHISPTKSRSRGIGEGRFCKRKAHICLHRVFYTNVYSNVTHNPQLQTSQIPSDQCTEQQNVVLL
jgi:hypothetical protein